jgi:hypothetical protein
VPESSRVSCLPGKNHFFLGLHMLAESTQYFLILIISNFSSSNGT